MRLSVLLCAFVMAGTAAHAENLALTRLDLDQGWSNVSWYFPPEDVGTAAEASAFLIAQGVNVEYLVGYVSNRWVTYVPGGDIGVNFPIPHDRGFWVYTQDAPRRLPFSGRLPDGVRRFAHLSPDAPTVDVIGEDTVLYDGLTSGSVTPYVNLIERPWNIGLTVAGTSNFVLEDTIDIETDTVGTYVVYDRAANLSTTVIVEDQADAPSGRYRLRFGHFAPSLGDVSVSDFTAAPIDLYGTVRFGASTIPQTLFIDRRTIGINTDINPETFEIVLDLPVMRQFGTYLLLMSETANGRPIFRLVDENGDVRAVPVRGQQINLRVMLASNEDTSLDVYANGTAVATSLEDGETSSYTSAGAFENSFAITLAGAGAGNPEATFPEVILEADRSYTLVVWGSSATGWKTSVLEDQQPPTFTGQGNIRFFNAIDSASTIGVDETVIPLSLVSGLSAGEANDYIAVSTAIYQLALDVDEDNTVDARFALPRSTSNRVGTVFVMENTGGGYYLLFQRENDTVALVTPQVRAK